MSINKIPNSLRLIDNNLWCCCGYSGIRVLDLSLNLIRHIPIQDMGRVLSMVDIGDGAVVAANKGLFLITYSGMFICTYPTQVFRLSLFIEIEVNMAFL